MSSISPGGGPRKAGVKFDEKETTLGARTPTKGALPKAYG